MFVVNAFIFDKFADFFRVIKFVLTNILEFFANLPKFLGFINGALFGLPAIFVTLVGIAISISIFNKFIK